MKAAGRGKERRRAGHKAILSGHPTFRPVRGTAIEFDGSALTLEVPRAKSTHVAAAVLEALPVADITIEEIGAEEVSRNLFQKTPKPVR